MTITVWLLIIEWAKTSLLKNFILLIMTFVFSSTFNSSFS